MSSPAHVRLMAPCLDCGGKLLRQDGASGIEDNATCQTCGAVYDPKRLTTAERHAIRVHVSGLIADGHPVPAWKVTLREAALALGVNRSTLKQRLSRHNRGDGPPIRVAGQRLDGTPEWNLRELAGLKDGGE